MSNNPPTPTPTVPPKIVFISNRDGNFEIYIMNIDGTEQERLTNNTATDSDPAWSPDGTKIIFYSSRDNIKGEIYIMDADGSNQTRLTNNSVSDAYATWSPVASLIAYQSDSQIHLMKPDGSE